MHVASEESDPDLFWAIRGGGGNFGVVTSFEFALSPVQDIYGGPMFFELDKATEILRFFRDYIKDAPEQYGGFPAFQIAPPLPFIPENRHGEPFVALVSCWTGRPEEGEKIIDAFRDVATPVAEHIGAMPYPALNGAFDALVPPGLQHYWKASFVHELTDAAIEAHLVHGPKLPAVNSTVHIYPINGAVHRVAPDATAFAYRDAEFATVIAGMWPDPAQNEANIGWVKDYYAAIAPHSEAGTYVNFMADDEQDRMPASYRGNYERLAQVKRTYDPDNLFRLNQNIQPA
jgi:FAD/FMN-containing dehydrogenase